MIKFLKFVPIQITFFLIIGILIGSYFIINPLQLVITCCLTISILGVVYLFANKYIKYFNQLFTLLVFLTFILIGISSITFKNSLNKNEHYSNTKNFNVDTPIQSVLKIRKALKPNKNYNKYEAIVLKSNHQKTIGKIIVNLKKDSLKKQLQVDDEILVKTEFRAIPKLLNPYGFNYKNYLKKQQVHHQIYISNNLYLKQLVKSKTIYGLAANIRTNINDALVKNGFKNDELAVVNALLLGQRQSISADLLEDYSDTGAIHILAVSGLHIGIILLLLMYLFKPLHNFKHGKLIATIIIILLLWFYAIIAGLSASVVRAVTMFTAISIGLSINRPSNIYNTLIISMFFLLLFNPYYLFEVGFQLSYLAVFSIVWIQPKIYNLLEVKWWLLNKFWQLFSVSIAAQIGVLPLSLFYFHTFPGLFFVSNLLIIPFLGFILGSGILVIVLALLNILPSFIANAYIFVIAQMNAIISWVSNIKFFIVENIYMSIFLMLSCYLLIVVIFKWFEKKVFYRLIFVLIAVILFQTIFIFEKYKRQSTKEFIIFNNNKSTVIAERNGEKANFFVSKNINLKTTASFNAYLTAVGLNEFNIEKSLKNLYQFNNKTILVVDSLAIYNISTIKPSIILLQHSPKINLNRLIQLHQPKLIIADASNYRYLVANWKAICLKNKTPFYNTMQNGAYILKE